MIFLTPGAHNYYVIFFSSLNIIAHYQYFRSEVEQVICEQYFGRKNKLNVSLITSMDQKLYFWEIIF